MTNVLCLKESDQIFPVSEYPCPNKLFLNHKYAMKRFKKEFALQGSFFLPFYELLKLVVLVKWKLKCP